MDSSTWRCCLLYLTLDAIDPFVLSRAPPLCSPLLSDLRSRTGCPHHRASFPSYAGAPAPLSPPPAPHPLLILPLPRNRLKRVKADKMIGVGKAKQYANVLDKPLSRGRQEVRAVPAPNSLQIYTRAAALDPCSWCRSSSGRASPLHWKGDPFQFVALPEVVLGRQ